MHLRYIEYNVEEGIAWIKFNRPEKLNALNTGMFRDLEEAIKSCEEDDAVRVVVLTGGEKAFIAGADLDEIAKSDIRLAYEMTDLALRVQERLADLMKPTIAAIAGFALGGGCELALCCDFRIAGEDAVFGMPEITLGLIPGGGGTQRLPRLVTGNAANRMLFWGEKIDAQEALRIGLVDRVVALEQLEAEAKTLAGRLAEKSVLALRALKTAVKVGINGSLKEGLKVEQDVFCMLFGTEDKKEGISAFFEKRKPVFSGR